MKHRVLNALIILAADSLDALQCLGYNSNKDEPSGSLTDIEVVNEPAFFYKSPEEGLMEALEYYGVEYPNIVYAQAVLETGNFKSDLCINGNNLFGLYNSRKERYYTFDHWTESVEAYINLVQYKYKPPNDYYQFLKDLPYAEDKDYINKLKNIVRRYE